MAEENSKSPHSQAQQIPLSKIHDLPGVFVGKQPDKSYGGLVTSIQAGGVKEPVVLRLREDGEYQLVTGYRRRRASELAKKQDIPALVYEMSMQEAQDYHHRVKNQPDMAIPGKLVPPPDKGQTADLKGPEKPTTDPKALDKAAAPKTPDKSAAPAAGDKAKGQKKPAEGIKAPADAAPEKGQTAAPKTPDKAAAPKAPDKAAAPAAGDKSKGQDKPAEGIKAPADATPEKGQSSAPKPPDKAAAPAADNKAKGQEKPAAPAKDTAPTVVTGPAAKGPAGTAISQVLPERLSPPDEAAKKDFPAPKEGESIFVTLHPAYLVKSEYNTISVDPKSEDYQELKKSIELNGVKDPVLARIGDAGTLEIVSGQRRHMIATELNYPVPTIIQKISDPDVKILVADGNLHRPKISTYDLARSLRMKMEGMKQKSGRRKKGTFKAEELDSDHRCVADEHIRYPLVRWDITEAQALQICYDRGFDWGGLYEIYERCSCWCCPLQQIGELRKLRHHHPELWAKLMELDQRALDQFGHTPLGRFKDNWTVAALEERFAAEDRELCLFDNVEPKRRKRRKRGHTH